MRKYIPILIILLFGLFALPWSQGQYMISLGDFSFPTNKVNEFLRMLYAWDTTSLGFLNFMILGFSMPYGIYLAVTYLLNISSVYSQIFWNYLLFSSLGLSMYLLVIQVIPSRIKYAAGLLSALFFMFNPWGASGITMFIPYVTFIPLILSLYIHGLNNNMGPKYLVSISSLWYFISSFSIWNIRGFIFQWMILIFYFLFFCLHNQKKIKQALKFTFILFIIYILLNLTWLILFTLNITKSLSESSINYYNINYARLDSFTINSSSITFALRMLDSWAATANFKGIYYFSWLNFYKNLILVLLGFIPTLAAMASVFYVIRSKLTQHTHVIFFFALVLFGLFISMGQNNPLTLWLADNVPLFATLFTLPSFHGGVFVAIGYSVLIGYGFMFICQRIKNFRVQIVLFLLCFAAIMTYGYPIWSGQFIPSGNRVLGAGRYRLPSYVLDLVKKISQERINYRVFPLPYSILGYYAYNWEPAGFNGPDPLINILNKSEVIGTGLGRQIADLTKKNIDKKLFFRLNSLLNVKYIMNKRDANLLHIKNNSWYTVPDQAFLNSLYEAPYDFTVGISSPRASSESKSLRSPIGAKGDQNNAEVSTFGQIDLIKIPDELFLPKLYTPLKIINTANITELPNIVARKDHVTRSAIFVGNHPNIPNTPNSSQKTILEYRMISPVKYRVRVHNAAGTFPLVMSESYHEGWKAYLALPDNFKFPAFAKASAGEANIQGTIQNDNLPAGPIWETLFKKQAIKDTDHIMVNGYANSWIVDTNKICNFSLDSRLRGNDGSKCLKNPDGSYDFELVIEFWPQRLYYLGLAVSGTTLLGCLSYLVWAWIHGKKRRVR